VSSVESEHGKLTRLITAYAGTTEQYAIAVARLRSAASSEFRTILAESETARAECGKTRRALQKHRAESGAISLAGTRVESYGDKSL
jgi:hypothetical protein